MHPTALPGPYGIGTIGASAREFIDILSEAQLSVWQVLPLGPTVYGDSPYQSLSSFAGNPLLIDLERLRELGDLASRSLSDPPTFPRHRVDYQLLRSWKEPLLADAATRFLDEGESRRLEAFADFCNEHAFWLDDFVLFTVLRRHYNDAFLWNRSWKTEHRMHQQESLDRFARANEQELEIERVLQFYYFEQWKELRSYAREKGISILGDIAIYVSPDGSDVWSRPELFLLDENRCPSFIAGVPPDYFASEGQLWGNPLYDWDAMKRDGYRWWIERIRFSLKLYDMIRIDHFRGFQAYWKVPSHALSAGEGVWEAGPGADFFLAVQQALGELPILAEDLGHISPEVLALRDQCAFPGMKVLQFAFERNASGELNADNAFLPHNYPVNCVAYTGTHDNDTSLSWYQSLDDGGRDLVRRYLGRPDDDIVWDMIRALLFSPARLVIIPVQDLLLLGNEARMNTPSTIGGNWEWRMESGAMNDWIITRLRDLLRLYGRGRP